MIDIADDCSKDWIEREGPDGKSDPFGENSPLSAANPLV